MELARPDLCLPASFDSRLFSLIISASSSQLSQHQKEANQAQYFGGSWRKCLIRYFNILFYHSVKEFQDLDEVISQYIRSLETIMT